MAKENENENSDILGYGKILKVLVGSKDGEPIIQNYHFTPVSLKDMPELNNLLDKFFKIADGIGDQWDKSALESSASIIQMSTKKMHPDLSVDQILEQFTLTGIAKAVSIVMDVNDFLSSMEALKNQSLKAEKVTSI